MIKIAISGKGGVGKTTLSGTLARLFARKGYDVLAIDADPSMNLASALGIKNPPRPLTEYKELIDERAGGPAGVFKLNPKVDDIVDKFGVTGPDNVKLLVMGTVERGGSGCMCPASSFLKALMRHVILKLNSVVILDMEAGVEHLGRGTTKGIDYMIIVVEPGTRSIETAGRIAELGRQIGIDKFGIVINKAGNEVEVLDIEEKLKVFDLPVIGSIPFDNDLIRADLDNISPIERNGTAISSIITIFEKLSNKME
ncbi:MAG: CODH nickel-insertion accessory protein [Candidatus Methanoperedens nitroreducens]|uniref:CODH nickel-insertion accessory protein n=1 Tax=Candidatus Methanoperedens nitratireducens TaxID=1392998 RepID=A0A0P8AB40_9EURY|nr:AAA family ATPase [Candidatus Methanoperedens sp. BLZ2]KAB2946599.1 MAG: AAA family ATPase [Candidatus Methanoperedens sp.]KPQ41168.1 MAG: CODH nickel-insertion accessory protein [Candidatus Methanoperedens sp. BLZ1]MBZ0173932.1 AAA family ATPase [Candidatus Methanoperedens nitroreducens]MCX9078965.1 AAA family ATPase [Candidatus Methanoperedens sp.]MCX9087700.1 AAA family ATPase [Candidatus Methanoperedens sp.]